MATVREDRKEREAGSARDRILAAAEVRARAGGYHGFSFRDLAADVGIKSASVHYHFPTKEDLVVALTRSYTNRARGFLEAGAAGAPDAAIARVTALFRNALIVEDRMCLCGLFGAERDALPPPVAAETAIYLRMLVDYLAAAFGADWSGPTPESIVARLEGALILARATGDPSLFDKALDGLP